MLIFNKKINALCQTYDVWMLWSRMGIQLQSLLSTYKKLIDERMH